MISIVREYPPPAPVDIPPTGPVGDLLIVSIEATEDSDTQVVIPHGLGVTPLDITITPMQPQASVSEWMANTINATEVILVKRTDPGSGGPGDQIRVVIRRPPATSLLGKLLRLLCGGGAR